MYNFYNIPLNINQDTQEYFDQLIQNTDSIKISQVQQSEFLTKYQIKLIKGQSKVTAFLLLANDNTIKYVGRIDVNANDKSLLHRNNPEIITKNLATIVERLFIREDKNTQQVLDKITCSNDICPICNSKMVTCTKTVFLKVVKICSNKCYKAITPKLQSLNVAITFFPDMEDEIIIDVRNQRMITDKINTINEILRTIEEWKENDKYLIYLLE